MKAIFVFDQQTRDEVEQILSKNHVIYKNGCLPFGLAYFFEFSPFQWYRNDIPFKLRNIKYFFSCTKIVEEYNL